MTRNKNFKINMKEDLCLSQPTIGVEKGII